MLALKGITHHRSMKPPYNTDPDHTVHDTFSATRCTSRLYRFRFGGMNAVEIIRVEACLRCPVTCPGDGREVLVLPMWPEEKMSVHGKNITPSAEIRSHDVGSTYDVVSR